MKITKRIGSAILTTVLISVLALNSVHVLAANPAVIDFSANDYIMDGIGGNGDMYMVDDGDRRVLFAECIDGYDAANDPDNTGTAGDLYATISYFEDYGVDADVYKWMKMSVKNESDAPFFEFHFESPTKGFNVETSVNLEINPRSDYTTYVYNVSEMCEKYYPKRAADVGDPNVYPDHWNGMITNLRLDFMYYEESGGRARTGDKIYIEYIAFFETKEAAEAWEYKPARTAAQVAEEKAKADAERAEAASIAASEAEAASIAAAEAAALETTEAEAEGDTEAAGENAADNETATQSAENTGSNNTDGGSVAVLPIFLIIIGAVVAVIVVVVVRSKKK